MKGELTHEWGQAFFAKHGFWPMAGGTEPSSADKTASGNKSGKPDKELDGAIAGLDFSDVAEKDREAVKKIVSVKAKQLQSDYSKKTEEVSKQRTELERIGKDLDGLKGIRDEFKNDPDLQKLYYDHKAGRLKKPDNAAAKDIKFKVDKLIENAKDAEDRQSLMDLKDIVTELVADKIKGMEPLLKKIEDLEDKLGSIESTSRVGLEAKVAKDILSLEGRFSKEIVGKYQEDLTKMGLKYPKHSMDRLFYQIADEADLKQALITEKEREEKEETEKAKNGLEPGSQGIVGDIEVPKDKGGRVIFGGEDGFIKRILKKHKAAGRI